MQRTIIGLIGTLLLLSACEAGDESTSTTSADGGGGGQPGTGGAAGEGGSAPGSGGGGGALFENPDQPEGTFACDPGIGPFCKIGLEYCETFVPGVCCSGGETSCAPLPDACAPDADCSCFGEQCQAGEALSCEQAPDGRFNVTCYGQ